jgi:hypothetical protein
MNHDSRVVRNLPVKVVYEKREPVSLSITQTDSFSLRDEIKKHLKLQVPSRELTLSVKPFDTGKDNVNLDTWYKIAIIIFLFPPVLLENKCQ